MWINGVAGIEKSVVRAGVAAWGNKWWINAKNMIIQIGWEMGLPYVSAVQIPCLAR